MASLRSGYALPTRGPPTAIHGNNRQEIHLSGAKRCSDQAGHLWRQKAEAALDGALKERETDAATGELAAAMQRIGELSLENELLRSRIECPGPLGRRRSR